MFSMYLKMNLGRQSWRHPFRVISPWMFFCSMGRVLMPWTSGSSPLCTRLPPRIAWKCVPCCWVTEPIPRWSTAMGRARWTWPRPQNSKRGSHVSLYSIYCLIKQPCSLLLKSELKTTYWDLSPFLSTSGIKANKTHPACSPCKCKWARRDLALIVPATFSLAPRQTHQGSEKDDFKRTLFSFCIIQAQWSLSSSLLMRLAGNVVIYFACEFSIWLLPVWGGVLTETLHNLLCKDFPLCTICVWACAASNLECKLLL